MVLIRIDNGISIDKTLFIPIPTWEWHTFRTTLCSSLTSGLIIRPLIRTRGDTVFFAHLYHLLPNLLMHVGQAYLHLNLILMPVLAIDVGLVQDVTGGEGSRR